MKLRVLFLLIAFFLVLSPVAQALALCGQMNGEASMIMTQRVSCQDDEQAKACVSVDSEDMRLSSEEGCFFGSLCLAHFYAIHSNDEFAKPLFAIPVLQAKPAHIALLTQTVSPEIKPPIIRA